MSSSNRGIAGVKVLRLMTTALRPSIDTLFPPTCWVDPKQADGSGGLSERARQHLAALSEQPYCRACGLTTGPYSLNDSHFKCGRCAERDAGVVRIARIGTFSEPLITLVHQLKFARAWEVARILAPFLYHSMLRVSEATQIPVDVMLPVPLHWVRRMRRGFNQSEELAREVAKLSGWSMSGALKRRRHTAAQSRIHAATRRAQNLRGAFVCRLDKRLAGLHVWLIDDVSTTGATLHAAATAIRKLPRQCRPASINAAVACVTDNWAPPPAPEIVGDFDDA